MRARLSASVNITHSRLRRVLGNVPGVMAEADIGCVPHQVRTAALVQISLLGPRSYRCLGQVQVTSDAARGVAGLAYQLDHLGLELRGERPSRTRLLLCHRLHCGHPFWGHAPLGGCPLNRGRPSLPRLLRNVLRAFNLALGRAGLPDVRFHDLRHAHATLLLRAGVALKTASARLGHSGIAITADLYQHVAGDLDADAAQRVADVLGDKAVDHG